MENIEVLGLAEPSLATEVLVRRPASVSFHDTSSPMSSDAILRKGKWTTEEEDYANKIISLFNRGLLSIAAGTTLRSYLSDKLHCDPMRITKKFAGASCIGKQVFQPSEGLLAERSEEIQELEALETLFFFRVGDRSGVVKVILYLPSPSAHRTSPEEESDNIGLFLPKPVSVKWTRDEGDTDIASAKHRATFAKIKVKTVRPVPSLGIVVGMRSVVSAPDFSDLKLMHESVERVGSEGRSRGFAGSFSGKRRSQSVTDFMDFEHYISDDSAAGDLLMQFASKVNNQSEDENENESPDEAGADNTGPVTKFISLSTIGNNNLKIRQKSPIKRNDPNVILDIDMKLSSKEYASNNENNDNNENDDDNDIKHNDNDNDNDRDEDYTDEDAIMVDQSSSLSCSSPQSHAGCNFEDEEEDTFDCYESCNERSERIGVASRNHETYNTVTKSSSEIVHKTENNVITSKSSHPSDENKNEIKNSIKDENKYEIKTEIKSENEPDVKTGSGPPIIIVPPIVLSAENDPFRAPPCTPIVKES